MQTLFLLIYRYRAFLITVFLEAICIWLMINHNRYLAASFFNTSNSVAGAMLEQQSEYKRYFALVDQNEQLALENALLREQVARLSSTNVQHRVDSAMADSSRYRFHPALVINNSTLRASNYITIDKGTSDGVSKGMGLVGTSGLVGRVKAASENYAIAYSLLHPELLTSVYHEPTGTLGTVQWDSREPLTTKLLYIPRHLQIREGDSVLTSGFSSVYPPDLFVGTIQSFRIDESEAFYDITLELGTDFGSLQSVYFVENLGRVELDSLQEQTIVE